MALIKHVVHMVHYTASQLRYQNKGAEKSLDRPGRKQAPYPAFYGTWMFITTFTRFHHLSLP